MEKKPFPPIGLITIADWHRFWAKIERRGDCWAWTGYAVVATKNCFGEQGDPYGQYGLAGGWYYAHRASYFLHYKVDPGELQVMHTCNNTLCVNPAHLELGTHSDNMLYRSECGRNPIGSFTGSALTEEDIPAIIRRYEAGETQRMIAQSYDVTQGTISNVVTGKFWVHVKRHEAPSIA